MLAQDDQEHPIPEALRPRFSELVAALVAGDFELTGHHLRGVSPVEPALAAFIAEQVEAYGARLAPLGDQVWEKAVYRWGGQHWLFLIDLSTADEPVSDLVLHARLFEGEEGRIEVTSVHVP